MRRVRASGRPLGMLVVATTLAAAIVSCGGGGGGPTAPGIRTFLPTWVHASWTGGARGAPNDRRDQEATDWNGRICPASHLKLNYNGFTLNLINNCTITVTYAICVTKGTLQGANQCSPDPLETSTSRLLFLTINPGSLGDFRNASGNLGVNIFYCSDMDQITGGPVRCISAT